MMPTYAAPDSTQGGGSPDCRDWPDKNGGGRVSKKKRRKSIAPREYMDVVYPWAAEKPATEGIVDLGEVEFEATYVEPLSFGYAQMPDTGGIWLEHSSVGSGEVCYGMMEISVIIGHEDKPLVEGKLRIGDQFTAMFYRSEGYATHPRWVSGEVTGLAEMGDKWIVTLRKASMGW